MSRVLLIFLLTCFAAPTWARDFCEKQFISEYKADQRAAVAQTLGLEEADDDDFEIFRIKRRSKFFYYDEDGNEITNRRTLKRIENLNIGPFLANVVISSNPKSHIQAIGEDSTDKTQHVYHPLWSEVRDTVKFGRMLQFAEDLPEMRERMRKDIRGNVPTKKRVVAAAAYMINLTYIRVGNPTSAKVRKTHGMTTMKKKDVQRRNGNWYLDFTGKGEQDQYIVVADPLSDELYSRMRDLPGAFLFQYVDDDEKVRRVTAADVNAYMREISGRDYSAKEHRTFGGAVVAAEYLMSVERPERDSELERLRQNAATAAANRLGNQRATSRAYYIDRRVFDAHADGRLDRAFRFARNNRREGMTIAESAILRLLRTATSL